MSASDDRLCDLLVARATEGLGAAEAREIERAVAAERPGLADPEGIDLAAAAVYLAYAGAAEDVLPLPAALRQRVLRSFRPAR